MNQETLELKVAKIEGIVAMHNGSIELLMGFIAARQDKDALFTFLKSVVESKKFTKDATMVAKKFLNLDSSFGEHIFRPGQTEQ
ncbi:MAG: hypothetical protein KAR13_16255 [Desulfobulbaceae bacterium]|nr:hypothetical protein [Desulfobulbaceae bacterium]